MPDLGTSGEVIAAARRDGRTALIGYLPAGYPDGATTRRAAELLASRCDLLMLGHPTTDASKDGSSVSKALQRACSSGFDNDEFLGACEAITAAIDVPVLVFAYTNEILRLGKSNFCREVRQAGAVGIMAADLHADHAAKWIEATDRAGLDRIFTALPGKANDRLALVAEHARGFVYVPGVGHEVDAETAAETAARLRALAPDLPLATDAVGGDGASAARIADAVIAGSCLVDVLPAAAKRDLAGLESRLDELAAGLRR